DDLSPRLCDFGQSRLTHEQDPALGTLYYMAPEQADLKAIPDARWDVYALGALLYHLLTGGPPHRTPEAEQRLSSCESLADRLATYRQLVASQPRPSEHRIKGIDRRLADIVDRCLRSNPSDRFPNAQAVLDAFRAREKQRARRPLIFLGGIAPLVLLGGMFVFGLTAMEDAVSTAQRTLVARAMESHNVSSGIMARGVERELDQWRRELEQVAESPKFQILVSETAFNHWEARERLSEYLDAARQNANTTRRQQQRTPDASWFLVDALGYQGWRGPHSPDTLDKRWAHRDYYHGLDQEFGPETLPETIRPIREPHLSLAFRSRATKKSIVAQSVPVRNTAGEILAILAATRPLGNVLLAPYAEYKPRLGSLKGDDVNRTFAIVDSRNGRLLDHPWLQQQDNDTSEVSLSPQLIATLVSKRKNPNSTSGVPRTDYRDPTAAHEVEFSGEWLAAFSPVGTTGWFAIVQEKKDQALQPVTVMQGNILRTWLFALAVSGSVITLMWILVLRSLGTPRTGAGLGTSPRSDGTPSTALSTTPLETHRA
ncbi:MAG: serine/threonine protein kinase, partial [Planctomycetaceae bacterium]